MGVLTFKIEFLGRAGLKWYFRVKGRYQVMISPTECSCDCEGETWRLGGKRQGECKHIREMRRRVQGDYVKEDFEDD